MQKGLRGLTRNFLHFLTGQGSTALSAFVFNVVVVTMMPKEVFGAYSGVIALSTIFAGILDFGTTGYYQVEGARNNENIDTYFLRAGIIKLALLPVVSIVLALISSYAFSDIHWIVCIFYFWAYSLLLHSDIVFIPKELGRLWSVRRILYEGLTLIALIFSMRWLNITDAQSLVLIAATTICVGAVWAVFAASRHVCVKRSEWRKALDYRQSVSDLRSARPFAIWYWLSSIQNRVMVVLLVLLVGNAAAADYRVCFLLITLVLFIPRGLGMAIMPRMANATGDLRREILEIGFSTSLFVTGAVVTTGVLYGASLIEFVFGSEYSGLFPLWIWVCLALCFMVIQIFYSQIMNYNGLASLNTKLFALGMLVQLGVTMGLLPLYGVIGAGVGMFTGALVLVVAGAIALRSRRVGVDVLFNKTLISRNLIVWAVSGLAAWALWSNTETGVGMIVSILIYILFARVFSTIPAFLVPVRLRI